MNCAPTTVRGAAQNTGRACRAPAKGVAGGFFIALTPTVSLSPLNATLTNLPVTIANKRLTKTLSSLDATLTKYRGGAVDAAQTGTACRAPTNSGGAAQGGTKSRGAGSRWLVVIGRSSGG
jgi:hypothetical protein